MMFISVIYLHITYYSKQIAFIKGAFQNSDYPTITHSYNDKLFTEYIDGKQTRQVPYTFDTQTNEIVINQTLRIKIDSANTYSFIYQNHSYQMKRVSSAPIYFHYN